jgi:hypothetical protein
MTKWKFSVGCGQYPVPDDLRPGQPAPQLKGIMGILWPHPPCNSANIRDLAVVELNCHILVLIKD